MTLCICKCLNITLESETIEDNVDIAKLELTTTEQRDIFFSEKLVSSPSSTLKTKVAQQALLGQRVVDRFTVYFCLACGLSTHAMLHERPNGSSTVLIAKSILTTSDQVTALRKSSNFSPVFNLLLPGVTSDVEMKENIDTNNRTISKMNVWSTQPLIGNLNIQLRQTLESQLESKLEAVEDSVRQFKDQKYAEYEAFRERAHRDHKILASIISKARENTISDGLRVDTSLDNGPPSPQLPPLQRRRLSSIKDAKKIPQSQVIKRNRNFSHEEDSLDADVLFDLEGMDSHNSAISDQDDYDSDEASNDEGIQVSRPRGGNASEIAHSLPISVPNFGKERSSSRRELEDDEVSQDIAASIKALARSVHGDMFELPPKRCSTQI
ncbi:uncharacterized protein LOC106131126 isoform X2 [Amyelois transitella]|uniref:uncharacterized protein LOC106131126 isoform X2 n=1 Tax=Amyelois transitella TaxID=680683 RepID=UPI00298FBF2B|nr:uncharacterized protein LOC106131126 isoform X2 [Amyelois transitella]